MENQFQSLDWTVEKRPLQLADGTETPFYAVVRTDNNDVFASVKKGYALFQNRQMIDLVNAVSSHANAPVHRAGVLDGGRKVFVQLKSPMQINGIGENNDRVDFYTTCINSHDGTTALSWGNSSLTISCSNTFYQNVKRLKDQNRAKHTQRSIEEVLGMIDSSKKMLEAVNLSAEMTADKMVAMSRKSVSEDQINRFIAAMVDVDFARPTQDINAKKFNRANSLRDAVWAEMNQKGRTAWGMFNGVTKFTTHISGNNAERRESSKMVGSHTVLDNKAFELAFNLSGAKL